MDMEALGNSPGKCDKCGESLPLNRVIDHLADVHGVDPSTLNVFAGQILNATANATGTADCGHEIEAGAELIVMRSVGGTDQTRCLDCAPL